MMTTRKNTMLMLSLIALFSVSQTFTSCTKPGEAPDLDTMVPDHWQDNRFAYFDPFEMIYYVLKDQYQRLMIMHELYPGSSNSSTASGEFILVARDLQGEYREFPIRILEVGKAKLDAVARNTELRLDEIEASGELDQLLISSKDNSSGYRCQSVDVARTTRCHNVDNQYEGSRSNYTKQEAYWDCKWTGDANDDCERVRVLRNTVYHFPLPDCKGSPKLKRIYVSGC